MKDYGCCQEKEKVGEQLQVFFLSYVGFPHAQLSPKPGQWPFLHTGILLKIRKYDQKMILIPRNPRPGVLCRRPLWDSLFQQCFPTVYMSLCVTLHVWVSNRVSLLAQAGLELSALVLPQLLSSRVTGMSGGAQLQCSYFYWAVFAMENWSLSFDSGLLQIPVERKLIGNFLEQTGPGSFTDRTLVFLRCLHLNLEHKSHWAGSPLA